jgi:S1-C subfamily serine protease
VPVDVTFDGQSQARLFATANSDIMATAILPPNVARTFQKASLMVVTTGNNNALQFNLTSTAPLLAVLANRVSTVKAGGINSAGEFAAPKPVAANPDAPNSPKAGKTGSQTGTGFVISANGHIITNHHVIDGCVGDIKGNLTGEAASTLRIVNSDRANDLALLQGPAESFKVHAKIRDRAIHSGDSVVAIGYPYHGLLSSDFTVTTGIVSSLSGMKNDTRELQISAAVQPGNSGGPLLDTNGLIVGVVTAKLDAISMARATGTIPRTSTSPSRPARSDNSVVPYETASPSNELKTSDIANNARAFTLLITCTGTAQAENRKK